MFYLWPLGDRCALGDPRALERMWVQRAASELRDDWLSSSDVVVEPMSGTMKPASMK